MDINKIYCEDCLDTMGRMDNKSIDLIFADPPYNAPDIGPKHKKYSLGPMQLSQHDYSKFINGWFVEAERISKCMLISPGIANICLYPQPKWILCWHKPAAVSFNRMGGFNAWEPILIYGDIPKGKRIGQDYYRVDTHNFTKGPESAHPCPKPFKLIRRIIIDFSLENTTVYDPFMGSGTTAVAAIKESRNYIGSEINPEYVKIINNRIALIQKKIEFDFLKVDPNQTQK